jgi:hypothetical protein
MNCRTGEGGGVGVRAQFDNDLIHYFKSVLPRPSTTWDRAVREVKRNRIVGLEKQRVGLARTDKELGKVRTKIRSIVADPL